jgi:hypothetical protein
MAKQETTKLSDEQKISNLRAEYQANIQLWIYEATFREQRSQMFLNINTILLVALGTLTTFSPTHLNTALIALLTSLFAFPTCVMWRQILLKNGEYMKFRRFQLRTLEVKLQNVTTFGNSWKALNEYEELKVSELEKPFQISKSAKYSAIAVENNLPLILTIFWAIVFLAALIFIVVQLT